MKSILSSLSTIDVLPHPTARDKAVAKTRLASGSTILKVPAFVSALLFSQKGQRCDHCLRLPKEGSNLKKCTGCVAYWYCDAQCQSAQWQLHHKRICKRFNQFASSAAFQGLEEHEKMDALLLTHLVAQLSTLPTPYDPEISPELSIFLSLVAQSTASSLPPICPVSPPPRSELVATLFQKFGSNNFAVHSHLNSIAHGIFPLASRLFNHSCVPNAAAKYTLSQTQTVTMEVVALRDIHSGEEISIPYLDPALMQSRHQIFQITYGFSCTCPACNFLNSIGHVPAVPTNGDGLKDLSRKLREFTQVDVYLTSDHYHCRSIQELPRDLYPVLNETFMGNLSEKFSESSHGGNYDGAADTGITLLALYLLVYPSNYPQIGMHLLEMAKTHWNYWFVMVEASSERKPELKREVIRLLHLAKRVLGVMGREGDDDGPFEEILVLENLAQNA